MMWSPCLPCSQVMCRHHSRSHPHNRQAPLAVIAILAATWTVKLRRACPLCPMWMVMSRQARTMPAPRLSVMLAMPLTVMTPPPPTTEAVPATSPTAAVAATKALPRRLRMRHPNRYRTSQQGMGQPWRATQRWVRQLDLPQPRARPSPDDASAEPRPPLPQPRLVVASHPGAGSGTAHSNHPRCLVSTWLKSWPASCPPRHSGLRPSTAPPLAPSRVRLR